MILRLELSIKEYSNETFGEQKETFELYMEEGLPFDVVSQ